MNFSVYLPPSLQRKLDEMATQKQISRNLAIREAIESWIEVNMSQKWEPHSFSFKPVTEVIDFKESRSDLNPPKEDIL